MGDRGVFGGGSESGTTFIDTMEYVTISTTGNVTDFGDLATARLRNNGASNAESDRGVFCGGLIGGFAETNTMEQITISSTGNGTDYGDLTKGSDYHGGCSNGILGVGIGHGDAGDTSKNMEWFSIDNLTNAVVGGDVAPEIIAARLPGAMGNGKGDVGFLFGGRGGGTTRDWKQKCVISTKADCALFGDTDLLLGGAQYSQGCASNGSNDRGLIAGGADTSTTDQIAYITMTANTDMVDFGNLSSAAGFGDAFSNGLSDRFVHALGHIATFTDTIDYVTISTTGNSNDFGDLSTARRHLAGIDNAPLDPSGTVAPAAHNLRQLIAKRMTT